jgi:adenylate cyclase
MSRRNSIELRRGSGLRETIPTTDSMFHRSPTAQSILNDTNDKRIIFQTSQRRSTITLEKVAKLVYNTSYGGKMEFELIKDETSLGRREDNDICLSDVKISKFHASIIKKDNVYYVMDKNSSNGVLVNDALIEPETLTRLYDNDVLLIGSIPLKFLDAGLDSSLDTVSLEENNYTKLVTILPSEKKYEETITIHQEFEAEEDTSFSKVEDLINVQTLKEDYEKLRLAYELSRMSVTVDVNKLLKKSLDLMFDIVPVERGVVLLVDGNTGFLSPHYVKLLDEKSAQGQEILLSSTILNKVFYSRKCVITRDAWEDPLLGKAASVRHGQIRSVICVPLMAHATVYGILHLDSKNRVNSFSSKDISLVKAISNQTAMVIENMNLIREVEKKARITEQLSRFLPPHVVDRMTNRSEMIRTGGREMVGTIVFADIRGFTKLSEKSNPTEVLSMLNDYFERVIFTNQVSQNSVQVRRNC